MIPVTSVLELACGHAPHMEELLKRQYQYSGLDINEKMLDYCQKRAGQLNIKIKLYRRDMIDFALPEKYDFAYTMVGSLFAGNTSELMRHFDAVARVLIAGGLYFLDWCIQFEMPRINDEPVSWIMEREGVTVKTMVKWKPLSPARQVFEETIKFEIDDNGQKMDIQSNDIHRAIYPQEFLRFIEGRSDFEFIGWWNRWNLNEPLEKALKIDRPIIMVRRK